MTRLKTARTGIPECDRTFIGLADQLEKIRKKTLTVFTTDIRTVSTADDATIAKITDRMTLKRLFINVDATIALDGSNWWSLRLVFYRPGYATAFGVQPINDFAGDEYIKTSAVPITAYEGIEIEYEQALEKGDLLVLEFTVGAGTPTNFTKTFIQADLLAR